MERVTFKERTVKRGIKFKISNTLFSVSFAVFCSRIDTQLTSKCSRGTLIFSYIRRLGPFFLGGGGWGGSIF